MKKLLLLALSLTLLLSFTVTANAAEITTRPEKAGGSSALFEAYYPEGIDTLESLKAEHQAFHESRNALRAEFETSRVAEKEAFKAAVAAGEMTETEVKELILSKRAEYEYFKEAFTQLQAEKKVETDAIKAERDLLINNLKEALKSDPVDASTIASYLAESNTLLAAHIAVDYKYAALVDALITGL